MDDAALPVPSREYATGPQFTPGALATPERTMVMAVFAGTEKVWSKACEEPKDH